ncbi:hypothetical protein [Actinosynnema sp. NPDC023587]
MHRGPDSTGVLDVVARLVEEQPKRWADRRLRVATPVRGPT